MVDVLKDWWARYKTHKHLGILMIIFSIKLFRNNSKSSTTLKKQYIPNSMKALCLVKWKKKKRIENTKDSPPSLIKISKLQGKTSTPRVLRFCPLLKDQHFQILNQPGPGTTLWMCYLQIIIYYLFINDTTISEVLACGGQQLKLRHDLIFGLRHAPTTKILQSLSLMLSEDHNNDQTLTFFATKQANHSYSLCGYH